MTISDLRKKSLPDSLSGKTPQGIRFFLKSAGNNLLFSRSIIPVFPVLTFNPLSDATNQSILELRIRQASEIFVPVTGSQPGCSSPSACDEALHTRRLACLRDPYANLARPLSLSR